MHGGDFPRLAGVFVYVCKIAFLPEMALQRVSWKITHCQKSSPSHLLFPMVIHINEQQGKIQIEKMNNNNHYQHGLFSNTCPFVSVFWGQRVVHGSKEGLDMILGHF